MVVAPERHETLDKARVDIGGRPAQTTCIPLLLPTDMHILLALNLALSHHHTNKPCTVT